MCQHVKLQVENFGPIRKGDFKIGKFTIIIGDTVVKESEILKEKQIRIIRAFIKDNYKDMYLKWAEMSDQGFGEE